MTLPSLHHEQLDVYKAATEFLVVATRSTGHFPRGYSTLADQLRRAALSIPLNIAEGYGKRGPAERGRFDDIARGSAHECGAIMDAAKILEIIDVDTFSVAKTLLYRIVSMLVKIGQ